ncbi:MAG: NAD(P)/FAD-dependent oxidoreductase [Geminicoccaceae bacterium]
MEFTPAIAIVGAGIAGLTCARSLSASGLDVRVFDKGRAPGGRVSTRRADGLQFDHGAPFFHVDDPGFAKAVADWQATGLVADSAHGDGFTAVPAMTALARHLAGDLNVQAGVEIVGITGEPAAWRLQGRHGEAFGPFIAVVVSAPAPQAAALLAGKGDLSAQISRAAYVPRYVAMAALAEPLALDAPVLRFDDGPISKLIDDSAKPGRSQPGCYVLHAGDAWSRDHLEVDKPQGARLLWEALADSLRMPLPEPYYLEGHRWRYALAERVLGTPCLFKAELRLGACGDWCLAHGVEGAWRSGRAMAHAITRMLG